jgi:hypothetical protein
LPHIVSDTAQRCSVPVIFQLSTELAVAMRRFTFKEVGVILPKF